MDTSAVGIPPLAICIAKRQSHRMRTWIRLHSNLQFTCDSFSLSNIAGWTAGPMEIPGTFIHGNRLILRDRGLLTESHINSNAYVRDYTVCTGGGASYPPYLLLDSSDTIHVSMVAHAAKDSEALKHDRYPPGTVIHGFPCHELALQLDGCLGESYYVAHLDQFASLITGEAGIDI